MLDARARPATPDGGRAPRRPAPVLHSPCPPKLLPSEGWIGEAASGPAGVEIPAETRRIGPAFAWKLPSSPALRDSPRQVGAAGIGAPLLTSKSGAVCGGVLPKSISASDVGQTFLSAGYGDFPVPGFRVKLSALVGEVGKLRNRQARKPALQFGQHALRHAPPVIQHIFAGIEPGFKILRCRLRFAHKLPLPGCGPVREIILAG
jgi:hypothetical protein